MMTHTPGPWHVREARWHEVAADAISDNGEEYELVIAQCDPAVQLLNNDSEIRANARLIAATPDLLAACDDAVAALMLLPPDCLDDVAGQPSRDELINNIFSAIARARPE